ncbi:MAG: PQQ-binding-like beta-propeller repeat protein, partial [Kitasatospora sp.]|nr:PQQ-binding-like beta-propeller repeat protein [Kitasatospora sp.]
LTAGAAALAAAGGATAAWLLRGDRDRTPRTSPYGIPYAAPVAHPTAGVAPRALWQVDGLAKDGPGPLATGPVVVAGHAPGLRAWTQDTGRPAWTWRGTPVGPLLTAGRGRTPLLLVADRAGGVTAVNARTGKRSWSESSEPGVRLLAADDHSLYVLDANRRVTALALDAEGRTRWTSAYRAGGKAPVAAAVARDRLLVVTREGTAVALNTATGARSWDRDLGGPLLGTPEGATAPAASAGVFCVGGSSLAVLDATHGKVRWSHPAEDVGAWAAPLAADGAVYAARQGDLEEGELAAYDLADGAPRWTCRLRFAAEVMGDPPVPGGPAVLEGNALVIPLGAERKAVLDTSRTDLGIATLDARTGRHLWTGTDDDPQIGWHLTAAAGRVFTHRRTRLTAHPSL